MLGEVHSDTLGCLVDLGRLYRDQERYEEAEGTLLEVHAKLEASLGAEHPETLRAIRALVNTYDAWDKPESADEWAALLPVVEEPKASD